MIQGDLLVNKSEHFKGDGSHVGDVLENMKPYNFFCCYIGFDY